jgi:hypothetical protein
MSADLLAEFDSFYTAPQDQKPRANPASNDLSFLSDTPNNSQYTSASSYSQAHNIPLARDDSSWGTSSFNVLPSRLQPVPPPTGQDDKWESFGAAVDQKQFPIQSSLTPDYGGFNRAITTNSGLAKSFTQAPSFPLPNSVPVKKQNNEDILFDADAEAEDDDDFGEFETGTTQDPPQSSYPQVSQPLDDLFSPTSLPPKSTQNPAIFPTSSLDLNTTRPLYQQAQSPLSFQKHTPLSDLGAAKNQAPAAKDERETKAPSRPYYKPTIRKIEPQVPPQASDDNFDEDWGAFEDLPPTLPTPRSKTQKSTSNNQPDILSWDVMNQPTTSDPPSDIPPPTNIPPPSLLLSVFPNLFNLPQSALFAPLATQPFSLKNRILSDPTTITFLRSYLQIATVLVHILAGRSLRWKRDSLLVQSTKISLSGTSKAGMKLTSLDKSEITREDHQAADVVRIWKEQLGRLRSAVSVANSTLKDTEHLVIPAIGEDMLVKTATEREGALKAPKPCVVCGLRREERVNRVDLDVQDTFGEWWTEYWGHRTCRNWWAEHETSLRNR